MAQDQDQILLVAVQNLCRIALAEEGGRSRHSLVEDNFEEERGIRLDSKEVPLEVVPVDLVGMSSIRTSISTMEDIMMSR